MSLSKCHTTIVFSILIAIAICGLSPKSNADIIHESANMGPLDQWPPENWIFDTQFLGSRFEITEATEITAIGGHIGSINDLLIFGAIVSLDNQNDFPSDTAWMNNLVAWTYFRPPSLSADIRTPLNVVLQPGWYGLIFGAGEFGSPNHSEAFMPGGGQSIYAGSSYFHWNGFWWDSTGYGPGYPRFVVEGRTHIPPVEIFGTKFNDIDGNGVWDSGEPNMPGWEIYIDENNNGLYEPSEPNTVTDSGGMYRFTNLDAPATYRVREIMKSGWTQTLPGGPGNEHLIDVEPGTTHGPYDFGNTDQPIQTDIDLNLSLDHTWMYQNLLTSTNSQLTADVSITDDPMGNGSYTYEWEIILPSDVTTAPATVSGGGAGETSWTFAAPSCNDPDGLSDSGQTFTVTVTVTGDGHGNTGTAQAQFGIALLGDATNDGSINAADRNRLNSYCRNPSVVPFTLRSCDLNCDYAVDVIDRSICNAISRGTLGSTGPVTPCPLR